VASVQNVGDAVLELAKLGRLTDETAATLGDEDAKDRLRRAGVDVPGESKDDDTKSSSATKGAQK
jgi:hypothetical protein